MWHREYMASCPISGTPSLHGHDKARRNCPVVIPRQVGGVWEWADLELAGCSSLPIASQPQRGPQGYRELSQRAGNPRCDGAAWRRCSALAREQLRLPPPRKSSAWVPLQAVQQARWRGHLLGPPMPHGGVAAGGSPAKPKQPNGDTRHLPLSELASDDLKFTRVGFCTMPSELAPVHCRDRSSRHELARRRISISSTLASCLPKPGGPILDLRSRTLEPHVIMSNAGPRSTRSHMIH